MQKEMTKSAALSDLAQITSGFHFPEGVVPDAMSSIRVVQPKDISQNGELRVPSLSAFFRRVPQPSHFLRQGDVLFISRMNPRAAFVGKNFNNVVASSHFFIIRTQVDFVSPEYLSWFLNQSSTQKTLRKVAQGTSLINVTKRDLLELEVDIPPVHIQKKIAAISRLSREYQLKHQRLQAALEVLATATIRKTLRNSKRGTHQ